MKLVARVEGIGLIGPGLAGWTRSREVLAGNAPYAAAPTSIPPADSLPAVERRRAGKSVRISLAAGLEAAAAAGRSPRDMGTVFTSSTGDGENVHSICETLASDDRMISPTRFHNSVHNAPSGYWGIATGSQHSADSLAAFDASFGAGLFEAMSRLAAAPAEPALLIAYDAPYPEPLYATRPVPDSFAVALVLTSAQFGARGPRITLEPGGGSPDILEDPGLESLRHSIPAARALPLLRLLARGDPARMTLEYFEGRPLAVTLS